MITPGRFGGPPRGDLSDRLGTASSKLAAACEHSRELLQRAAGALAENRILRRAMNEAIRHRQSLPARQELLDQSEYGRMVARLQTMPVIEQAKGIIMAQRGCGEAEAFDTLRRASQRSNVPVRELAAQLVAKAAGEATITRSRPWSSPRRTDAPAAVGQTPTAAGS
jgi:hypothetical protein